MPGSTLLRVKQLTDADWDTMRHALVYTIASLGSYGDDDDFRKECKRLLQLIEGVPSK
jgi:hypothetical protein